MRYCMLAVGSKILVPILYPQPQEPAPVGRVLGVAGSMGTMLSSFETNKLSL